MRSPTRPSAAGRCDCCKGFTSVAARRCIERGLVENVHDRVNLDIFSGEKNAMKSMRGMAAIAMLLTAWVAFAQGNYPEKSVRILVGFTPGVAPDVAAR